MTSRKKDVRSMRLVRALAAAAITSTVLLAGCDTFVSADKRIERAEEHMSKGQFRPAMADLKTALEQEPENARGWLALARLSMWLGDLESAAKELTRAESAGADKVAVRTLRYEVLLDQRNYRELQSLLEEDTELATERRAFFEVRLALASGDLNAARAAVERGLAASPNDATLLVERARIVMANGDHDAVLELADKVRQSPTAYADALMMRAAVLMERGQYVEARQALSDAQAAAPAGTLRVPDQLRLAVMRTETDLALNDIAEAERSLTRVANWAPQSYVAPYFRARIAMAKSDFATAVAEAQRATRAAPDHLQSQLLLASAHVAQGSLEQAQDVLTRLLANKAEMPAARKLLAQVYLGRKQPEEAQRVLAASGDAPDSDMDWLMGAALLRSGDVQSGVERLERSVAAAPDDVSRKLDLASAYIGAKMPEKAVAILNQVPNESALAARAKGLLVLASAAGKPSVEARREIQQLVAQHPDDAALLTAAGTYFANARDMTAARKHLERAIEIEPDRIGARITLARVDAADKKVGAAHARLIEVIKRDPANQTARIGLAEIAWTEGDREGARKQLEEAITADPAAIDARLRLAQLAFIEGEGGRARSLLDQAVNAAKEKNFALRETGRVLARAGLTDEALTRFKEAAAAGDPTAHLHAARLHMDLGDTSKARESAQLALRNSETSSAAEQLLVFIDARDGEVPRALDRAKRLAKGASEGALKALEGDLYAVAGQVPQALAAYESAQKLELSPQVAIKMFNLRRAAKEVAPERSLKEWLARSPKDATVRRMLAIYYDSSGDTKSARAEYESLLAGGGMDPLTMNNLAWILHQEGDARALDLAKRAYQSASHYPEIADTYGWILVRMDNIPEGLPVLKSALESAPANPEIQFHVAYAYAKLGQGRDAESLVKQALASKQPFPSRSQAEALLQSLVKTKT